MTFIIITLTIIATFLSLYFSTTAVPLDQIASTEQISDSESTITQQKNNTDDPALSNKWQSDDIRPASLRRQTFGFDLPKCARETTRASTFLMVFMGHSGSSALISELRSHPDVLIEAMEPVDHGNYSSNTTLALQYTRDFFTRGIQQGKTSGFKIRPHHIKKDPESWTQLAKQFNTRIIWQYRRNTLKHAVGEYSYRYLNDESTLEGLRSEQQVRDRCKIGVGCSFEISDMQFFHSLLNQVLWSDFAIAEATSILSDGRDCVHELRYEDYLYHRQGTLNDLFQFLGLPIVQTSPSRYKATGDNLCNVVKNWDELCSNFYGCAVWRHHFEDEHNHCSCKFVRSPRDYCYADPFKS